MLLKLKNEKAFSLVIVLIILTVGIAALSALSFALIRGFQSSQGLTNAGIAYNAVEIGVKEFDYQLLNVVLKKERFQSNIPPFDLPDDFGLTDLDANGLLLKAKCFYYAWDNNDYGEINKNSHDAFNTRWPCGPSSENCYYDNSGKLPNYNLDDSNADVFTCGNTNTIDDIPGGPADLGDEIPEEFSDCCEVLANKKLGEGNKDCKKNFSLDYFNLDPDVGLIEDINIRNSGQPGHDRDCRQDNGFSSENDYCRRDCYTNAWRGWGQDAWRCVNKNAVVRYTTKNPSENENKAVDWILDQVWEQANDETCKDTFENKEDDNRNKILGYGEHYVPVNATSSASWKIVSMERPEEGLDRIKGRIKVIFEGRYSGSKVKVEANWYQLSTNTWTQEIHLISD